VNLSEEKERTRVTTQIMWICDWDIPVGDRFRFYRALRRLKKELGLQGAMSSMSVLVTSDKVLASRVYNLALAFSSRVHLYEAREHTCNTTEERAQ